MSVVDADRQAWLAAKAQRTCSFMAAEGLRGWDPYDALLSPLFSLPLLRSRRWPRFAAQQLVLRSSVNLRPLLCIPKQLNAVTVGLYIQGVADLAAVGLVDREAARDEVAAWVEKLEEISSSSHAGACWGYPFPWEGRRHRMAAGHPTVVATGVVVNGLYRVWQEFGNEQARKMVVSSAAFVLDELPRADGDDEAFCWAYSSVDRQAVLNATMKGSRLLAQAIDAGLDDQRAAPSAAASARFVAIHQAENGAWPYAVDDPRGWCDHHHTGYVLECFSVYRALTGDREFSDAIDRGWNHYRNSFFDAQSLPRFYDNRDGPVDPTAAGQALITLSAFGAVDFATDVAKATTMALGRDDGSFAYRRPTLCHPTQAGFMRWSTAWMLAGIARLLERASTCKEA